MLLNLALPHLLGFIVGAVIIYFVAPFRGSQRWRLIGFWGLWQLLSPVRPIYIDMALLLMGFWITELVYFFILGVIDGSR